MNKITWYETANGGLVGYVGGFLMFRIVPMYGKGFFNFKIESYTVRTEAPQESGITFGYARIKTIAEAREKAEDMWEQMLEIFNCK